MARYFGVLFVCFALFAGACNKPEEKDLCGDVTCDAGVCAPSTGACVNPSTCDDGGATCLEGYECALGVCVASFPCDDDGACERGQCFEGACLNPDRCDAATDCVPGYTCSADVCIVDLCDQVTCERGICDKATGACANKEVCTTSTQESDCVDGFTCYNQTCADEATICADLDCQRGECSAVDLACVNSEDCAGSDLNCLDGFFCNAVNQCQQNVCDENGITCARGICDAATGACVNADDCDAANECVDGFYCVDGGCTAITEACAVCVGNQVCSYDEPSTAVVCDENPNGCVTSLDCIGSRECADRTCGPPLPCEADAQEPNNSAAAATDWFALGAATVAGTVCQGDADYFRFDVRQDPQFTGTLIALVSIPAADIGVGTITVEIVDPNGTTVATQTSQPTDSLLRTEATVGAINQGVYTIIVREGTVGSGGIAYDLYLDLAENNTVNMCGAAMTLGATQMGDTSASSSNSLGSACTSISTATEEAWILNLTAPGYVTISAQSNEFDPVLSLRRQCEADPSEIACANNGAGPATETIGQLLGAGSYFVIVQGTDAAQSGVYTITSRVEPVVCTSADNSCSDANTARVCNAQGTAFNTVMCDAGCDMATGTCIRELGDVCDTAIDATNGYVGTIPLGSLRNDYNPGACVSGSPSATDGPDAVFSVTLQPNELLSVAVDPVDFDNVSIYILDDCANPTASCRNGTNASNFSTTERLTYGNTSNAAESFYVVADAESGTLAGANIEISVAAIICTPGMQQCNGNTLETCNAQGTAFNQRTCGFGCTNNACVLPPNDTCGAGAIDVSAGGTFTGTIDDYNNDYSSTNSCTGYASNGAEAVYAITGTPGDVVTVTLDAPGYDTSLYAVTDCANIAGTCLAGDDVGGSQAEEIQFVLRDTNPVYIVADAYSSSPTGQFTLTVASQTPDCTTYGEAVTCTDAQTLQWCDQLGFLTDYTCDTTCTGAACDQPAGDYCFDAIPLTTGASVVGVYTDYTNTSDPGVGTCLIGSGNSQPGPDAIYAVDLFAGELLTASLTTTVFGASMYVLEDCSTPRDACLWGAPRSDRLEFFAATSGTYYLVVDSTSTFSTGSFQLDIDVQPGFVCQPGGTSCDQASSTLTVCSLDGTIVENVVTCPNGCANATACAGPTAVNDTCMTAEVVTGSIRYVDNWDRFTNVLDPGAAANNTCDFASFETDGPEAIYTVNLGAGDVLDVTVDDLGAIGSPAVYVVSNCADTENTCLAGDIQTAKSRVGYVSDLGGTVYIAVDNSDATVDDPFMVDIDIRPSQCVSTLNQCRDAMTREYCDSFGVIQTEDCFFGCTAGACNPPTNDTCATPADVTGGTMATIPFTGYNNDYGQSSVACMSSTANGPDAVFSLTATAGEVVTVRMRANTGDAALWVTTTCGDPAACVAGSESTFSGGIEEVSFVVPTTGTYYIMADSYSSTTSGTFDLEVIVEAPICTPRTATCDAGGQDVEACTGLGLSTTTYACDAAGCVSATGMCATATGEYPAAAFDANTLGQFTGSFANFVDDFNLTSQLSCTNFYSPGPDAAYYVDLLAGQTLTAEVNSSVDTSLYIMDGYTDPDYTCLVGDDGGGSGEIVSYTAPANMRVFVIVDAYTANVTASFTLDLSVQ